MGLGSETTIQWSFVSCDARIARARDKRGRKLKWLRDVTSITLGNVSFL